MSKRCDDKEEKAIPAELVYWFLFNRKSVLVFIASHCFCLICVALVVEPKNRFRAVSPTENSNDVRTKIDLKPVTLFIKSFT